MKKWVMGLLILVSLRGQGQTFDEWFKQKATQLKYLKQQIAALEAYTEVTQKGYSLIQEATAVIAAIKKGDFDLHIGYFISLKSVKQEFVQLITPIVLLQQRILAIAKDLRGKTGAGDEFFRGLLQDCGQDMDWLKVLTEDGQVRLKEDERLLAIGSIEWRMKQRLADAITARNTILEIQLNKGL